jgi:hypothetical protein
MLAVGPHYWPLWEAMIGRLLRRLVIPPGLTVLLTAALLVAVSALPALAAEASSRIDEASKRALSDRAIQKTLPGLTGGAQRPQPDPRLEPPRRPQPAPRLPERSGASGLGGFSETVLWVIAIVAGLALLYFVLREVLSLRLGAGKKRFEASDATVRARVSGGDEEAGPASLLDKADELAARGAFGEAIHLILMHSLGRLEGVSARAVGRSLTAREILRGTPITTRARGFLGTIVGASELTHFGGRDAGEADYRSCREAFQAFANETGAQA